MDRAVFNMLNDIYAPLIKRSSEIRERLKKEDFIVTEAGFFNNHYVKYDNEFVAEHYPIPVFSIKNIGDVGVDIDSSWVEVKLTKEKAVLLDYPQLARAFKLEVYGVENYCVDFYNDQSDPYKTADNIRESQEAEICVCFYFDKVSSTDEIVKAVRQCAV